MQSQQQIYGFFEHPGATTPDYDPPLDAPCLYCGEQLRANDVRTHSVMAVEASYAKRSYFYRTHRTCDDAFAAPPGRSDPILDIVLDMIGRNGD